MDTKITFNLFRIYTVLFFATMTLVAEEVKTLIYISHSPIEETIISHYQQRNVFIPMVQEGKLDEAIFTIQNTIRETVIENIKKKRIPYIVLYAKGFDATLMSIAQTNLLPEYREAIQGMILEEPVGLLPKKCSVDDNQSLCKILTSFQKRIGSRASFIETSKALSPLLQMDWYWSSVLLIVKDNQAEWKEAFQENGISYQLVNLEHFLPRKIEQQRAIHIQKFFVGLKKRLPTSSQSLLPNYFGAVLRFHLGKILYIPKNRLVTLPIAYGKEIQQQYSVYFKEHSEHNPLFIYVHGGGWNQGERSSFEGLVQQYADKGYTAIAIDYRLLQLPFVGMKEMTSDVGLALEHILNNAKGYHADANQTIVMAESAGAQLAFMGMASLTKSQQERIKGAVFNSIPADLQQHPIEKQIRLSGIKKDTLRQFWLDKYSPVKHVYHFYPPLLALQSMTDQVVPAIHLDELLLKAQYYKKPMEHLWIDNGVHPIAPNHKSLQPSYQDMEKKIDTFITKQLTQKQLLIKSVRKK